MDQNGAGPLPPLPNDHSLKLLIRWKEDNEVTPLASPKMEEWLEEKGKRSKGEVFLKTVLLVGQGIQIWIFGQLLCQKRQFSVYLVILFLSELWRRSGTTIGRAG